MKHIVKQIILDEFDDSSVMIKLSIDGMLGVEIRGDSYLLQGDDYNLVAKWLDDKSKMYFMEDVDDIDSESFLT